MLDNLSCQHIDARIGLNKMKVGHFSIYKIQILNRSTNILNKFKMLRVGSPNSFMLISTFYLVWLEFGFSWNAEIFQIGPIVCH